MKKKKKIRKLRGNWFVGKTNKWWKWLRYRRKGKENGSVQFGESCTTIGFSGPNGVSSSSSSSVYIYRERDEIFVYKVEL